MLPANLKSADHQRQSRREPSYRSRIELLRTAVIVFGTVVQYTSLMRFLSVDLLISSQRIFPKKSQWRHIALAVFPVSNAIRQRHN